MANEATIVNDGFDESTDEGDVLEYGILVTVPTSDASIAPAVIKKIARKNHVVILGVTNRGVRADSTLFEVAFICDDEDDIDNFIADVDSVEMPRDYRLLPAYPFEYIVPEIDGTLTDEEIDNLIEPATGLPNGKAVSRGKVINHSF